MVRRMPVRSSRPSQMKDDSDSDVDSRIMAAVQFSPPAQKTVRKSATSSRPLPPPREQQPSTSKTPTKTPTTPTTPRHFRSYSDSQDELSSDSDSSRGVQFPVMGSLLKRRKMLTRLPSSNSKQSCASRLQKRKRLFVPVRSATKKNEDKEDSPEVSSESSNDDEPPKRRRKLPSPKAKARSCSPSPRKSTRSTPLSSPYRHRPIMQLPEEYDAGERRIMETYMPPGCVPKMGRYRAVITPRESPRKGKKKGSSEEERKIEKAKVAAAVETVKSLYTPILKQDQKEITDYFNKFQAGLSRPPVGSKYKTFDGTQTQPLRLGHLQHIKFGETAKFKTKEGTFGDKVMVHYLPGVMAMPRMKHWVHIEHNIKTEDCLRLSHIPYVEEEHDSAAFCKELKKVYLEGIHGVEKGWKTHISDFLMYKLLLKAQPIWTSKAEDLDHLYQAIFQLFPNKFTPRQLELSFLTLEQRFNPKPAADRSLDTEKKEEMYHSISTMLCIKCQQYNCLLHGIANEEVRMHRKPRAKKRSKEPCGEKCYLHVPAVKEILEYEYEEDEPIKKYVPVGNVPPFSQSAELLFHKMVINNRHAACQLSVMMDVMAPNEPRTCAEIYDLMQAVPSDDRPLSPDDIMERKISKREQQSSFRSFTWEFGEGKVNNSAAPLACRHDGLCGASTSDCYCGQHNTLCGKYCSCGPDCKMRFPGCRCQPGACRTRQCQCFYAKWECDPDVCRSCNCGPYIHLDKLPSDDEEEDEVDDAPPTKGPYDDSDDDGEEEETEQVPRLPVPLCSNMSISRGNYKELAIGKSEISGYGCFIMEEAEKAEFIAEYTGEVISKWEAERRGRVYDEYKCSYIFALNDDQSIDATRFGNHIRFANHSDKHPNCFSQIVVVNGEHRIGIYAKRKIFKYEELLFDYKYDKKWKEQYVPVEAPKPPLPKPTKPPRRRDLSDSTSEESGEDSDAENEDNDENQDDEAEEVENEEENEENLENEEDSDEEEVIELE